MAAVGIAWDVQRVPKRIYEEARAAKAQRPEHRMPSIVDALPLPMELAEDAEPVVIMLRRFAPPVAAALFVSLCCGRLLEARRRATEARSAIS